MSRRFFAVLFDIWQNFEPNLANTLCSLVHFQCCERPNLDQIIYPSGHTVLTQLVKQSFPNPEVCGSNVVISKFLYGTFYLFTVYCIENSSITKKRPGMEFFIKSMRVDTPCP